MNALFAAGASLLALALAAPNAAAPTTPAAAAAAPPALSAATFASDEALLHAYPTTIDAHDLHLQRCSAPETQEGELALTVVDIVAHVPFPDVDARQRYNGRAAFRIAHVTLRMPRSVDWPGMTARDRAAVDAMLAALRHHEVGHVRVAVAEVARLNALPLTVTPDAEAYRRTVTRRADDGMAALARAQREYDELTDHGRRQDRAGAVLAGPPTELICSGPPRPLRTHRPDPYTPAQPSPGP